MTKSLKKKACEEVLRKNHLVTEEDLQKAIAEAEKTGEYLHQVVVDMGLADKAKVLEAMAVELGVEPIDLLNEELDPDLVVTTFPQAMEVRNECIPVGKNEDTLTIAMADPHNPFALNEIKIRQPRFKVQRLLAFPRDIREKLEEIYGKEEEKLYDALMQDDIAELAEEEIEQDEGSDEEEGEIDLISAALEEAQRAPVMRLVDRIIAQAIREGANDIHIEPFPKETKLRYRIDGVLQPRQSPPRSLHNAIISRIKIMAKANIAERRTPQDGRISVSMGNKKYELRVSIIPAVFGESVVMRILDKGSAMMSLSDLGFSLSNLELITTAIKKPYGLILVSGPTGSGKSTTLFSALNTIYSPEIKILTIENPVEYNLDGVVQVQTKEEVGLTFAKGLRAFLRHDPDVIMVGEIRDSETAGIAVQAALTGHLVLSTIHTNDAPSCVTRLAQFGIDPFLIADSIQLIIAQRLLQTVCKHCKVFVEPTDEIIEYLNSCEIDTSNLQLCVGKGCPKCNNRGLRGRTGIHELLALSNEIKALILKDASAYEIKEVAMNNGIRTLRQDGLEKVAKGITTLEEVLRVTQEA